MTDQVEDVGTAGVGAFRDGYVGAAPDTALPPTASPRAYNTALALSRTGVPYAEKRKGVSLWAEAPASEAAATSLWMFPFQADDEVVESADGVLSLDPPSVGSDILLATTASDVAYYDPSSTPATRTTFGSYTATVRPAWVNLGNAAYLLCSAASTKHYKVTRTSLGIPSISRWGCRRPDIGTTAGAAGAAGLHNGTYELRVTFYTDTGHESSASDTAAATVTVANQAINWTNVPVPTDTETDIAGRYLYVRNTATQTQFYRVGSIADTVTTTATTSVADDLALTVAPGTADRNPPPSNAYVSAVYRNRVFIAGPNSTLRWSLIGAPEAFDSTAYATIGSDADIITGLAVLNDRLVITKTDSTWALAGEVGDAYSIDQVDGEVGGLCHQTLAVAAGMLYWWSRTGLVRWSGVGRVEQIGAAKYGDVSTVVAANYVPSTASATVDTTRGSLYVALPGYGQTRATLIIPFNYVLGVFEAAYWDPLDPACLGAVTTSTGRVPLVGSHVGQLFQLWSGHADGVAGGTTASGTFTASSTSHTTITDLAATFDTADVGLAERKVSVYASDGTLITVTRPRITSNTATAITFTPAISGLTVDATYTYVIGGPDFQLDTAWIGYPFSNKRYTFCHLLCKGSATTPGANLTLGFDYDMLGALQRVRTLPLDASSSLWDDALWDTDVWSAPDTNALRLRAARVGTVWRVRVRNGNANQPFAILGITMRHQPQGLS